MKEGDEAVLFDGSGSDHKAVIVNFFDDDGVVFRLGETFPSRFMPARKIYLCAAVVKKDNFELIVEKATELGVTDIIPVLAEHSEKKSLNMERLNKIAIEASEQSGRGDVPAVHPIVDLKQAIDDLKKVKGLKLVAFHAEGDASNRSDLSGNVPLALFVGPEGGWSPEEITLFHKENVDIVCLGSQVLRAETAVIAALSVVVFNS